MLYKYLVMTIIFSVVAFSSCSDNPNGQVKKPVVQDSAASKSEKGEMIDIDEYPTVLKSVVPVYPEEAKKKGITGDVVVQAFVDKGGNVQELKVVKNETGSDELGKAALDAVKQWKFKPATKKGDTVSVWIAIPVKFKLENGKDKDK